MSDFEVIRAYLVAVDRWREEFEPKVRELLELREARSAALERAGAQPTVLGSKGQERENPAWGTALRLQGACDRLDQVVDEPHDVVLPAPVGRRRCQQQAALGLPDAKLPDGRLRRT